MANYSPGMHWTWSRMVGVILHQGHCKGVVWNGILTAVGRHRSAADYVLLASFHSTCTKAVLILCFHCCSCFEFFFFSPLSSCFKQYGTKSNVWPLSQHHVMSLLKSYISPPIMYIKGLSQVKTFLPPIMPQCTWISYLPCENFSEFFPHLCVIFFVCFFFSYVVLIRTQHGNVQWRLYLRKDVLYAITDF